MSGEIQLSSARGAALENQGRCACCLSRFSFLGTWPPSRRSLRGRKPQPFAGFRVLGRRAEPLSSLLCRSRGADGPSPLFRPPEPLLSLLYYPAPSLSPEARGALGGGPGNLPSAFRERVRLHEQRVHRPPERCRPSPDARQPRPGAGKRRFGEQRPRDLRQPPSQWSVRKWTLGGFTPEMWASSKIIFKGKHGDPQIQ